MATIYAVGPSFTWNATAGVKWASSSGGAGGTAGVPTTADDVVLDAASGAITVTIGVSVCRSLTCTGFTGTLSHPSATTLPIGDATAGAGNVALLLVAGMTYTLGSATTSAISFVSTSATQQTITSGGKTLGNVAVSGAGGSWLIADTYLSTGSLTYSNGALDMTGRTVTFLSLASASGTRVFTITNATITTTGASVGWALTGGGVTFAATGSTINVTASTAAQFSSTSVTYATVTIQVNGGGQATGTFGGCTIATLTITGSASKLNNFRFNGAVTVTTALTFTGNSADANRLLVLNATVGTAVVITATGATVSGTTNTDFADVTISGATLTGTSLGDAGGNSGITFTTSATQTHTASAGGNWSDITKWTSRVPLPQDDVVVDVNTTGTLTVDMPRLGRNLTLTGFAGTIAFTSLGAYSLFGSVVLATGLTITGVNTITLAGRGSHSITSAGKTWATAIIHSGPGGTYTLADAFTTSSSLSVSDGSFVDAGFAVTCTVFTSASLRTRAVTRTGAWTITSTAATTVWNISSTGLTMTNTGSVTISNASTNSRTFAGGGLSYGTLTYTVANSPGPLVITGANTFTVPPNIGPGRTVTFPSSATTTFLGGSPSSGSPFGYQYVPGVSGNYASAPDSAALSITGDIDIRVRIAFDLAWSGLGAFVPILAKYGDTNGNRGYLFAAATSGGAGKLAFYASFDGTAANNVFSTVAVPIGAATTVWVRGVRVAATGVVTFSTASGAIANPVAADFATLGGTATGTAGNIFDNTAAVEVGTYSSGNPGNVAASKVYRAQIRNGIDGTLVFDADFTAKPVGTNSFAESSANAATVTINGSLAQVGDGRVSIGSSTPGVQHALARAA